MMIISNGLIGRLDTHYSTQTKKHTEYFQHVLSFEQSVYFQLSTGDERAADNPALFHLVASVAKGIFF
jgi:hypothetical protein